MLYATFSDSMRSLRSSVSVASELGNAHEIIFALGSDMNEAARIAALSPAAKGAALATFAAKISSSAGARISAAPAPIVPAVGGNAPAVGLADDLTPEDWFRIRQEQKRKGRAA